MFSISSFRNESGCFEQEKCPRVYLSSLGTKMHTRHVNIQSLFLEIQEVKWRCTTVDLIPDRARTRHLRGWMAEYIPNILDIRAMAEVNIYWCHLSIFFKSGSTKLNKSIQWSSPDGVWTVLWTARHHPSEQPWRVDQAPEEHTVQQQSSHHADNLFWHG